MKKIILHPLKGIEIVGDGFILLSSSEEELLSKLGQPTRRFDNRLFYEELECRFDLNEMNNIEFVEFIYGPYPEKTLLEIYEVNPFTLESNLLVELLSSHNYGEIDKSEAPLCYSFKEIATGVFKKSSVSDIEKTIEEMKSYGEFVGREKELADELEMAKFFMTIGLGVRNYYS